MSAIPNSDMPGHTLLHDRVVGALDRCQESQAVEFKESAQWDDLKWAIVRTAQGMANLRDGGVIVVGLSERSPQWNFTGISESHLATYDVDNVISEVNSYASPDVSLDIVTVAYRGKKFLAIQVREFSDTPIVCKKDRPTDSLEKGAVYIRPTGVPRTTKVTDATQMHDLLELAAEKRAKRFMETARRVGILREQDKTFTVDTDALLFKNELEGL